MSELDSGAIRRQLQYFTLNSLQANSQTYNTDVLYFILSLLRVVRTCIRVSPKPYIILTLCFLSPPSLCTAQASTAIAVSLVSRYISACSANFTVRLAWRIWGTTAHHSPQRAPPRIRLRIRGNSRGSLAMDDCDAGLLVDFHPGSRVMSSYPGGTTGTQPHVLPSTKMIILMTMATHLRSICETESGSCSKVCTQAI
jgi:hypothetical protein